MKIIIDGLFIASEDDFHKAIAKELNLPSWYGHNLNALWDVLTGMIERPLELVWLNSEMSRTRLGRYEKIIELLEDISNRDVHLGRKMNFEYILK